MAELTGKSIIGYRRGTQEGNPSYGYNPASGEQMAPAYFPASAAEVDLAAQLAGRAFASYRRLPGRKKAAFLRKIAEGIEALGEILVTRGSQETGLPAGRITMETGRTCGQLRLFADLVEEGSWVDARIDRANAQRQPLPKPDVRSMLQALGPVVVFAPSNFPLAFSVAGGDTASALAGGNPVIVKAHHAHPGTAELAGNVICEAARACDLPEGVFSLLYGAGSEVGMALVKHPAVKAVGFTGSRAAGQALMQAAASRPEPIPVYAEMSSINPFVILPGALRKDLAELAAGLHGSVTLGAGQFCTNPGLVLLPDDANAASFTVKLATLMSNSDRFTMLTPGTCSSYHAGVSTRAHDTRVTTVVKQAVEPGNTGCHSGAALFQTDGASFLADPELGAEIFGPSTLLVNYSNREQLLEIVHALEGQLTATVHGTEQDLNDFSDLLAVLETRVGRLIFNGFPTGVEVCHAMVHGGPFPATSDGRSTSVGTRAILRFARQVCYQSFPDSALPSELESNNPLKIWRMVDGNLSRDPLA
ncbi:MAG TPA: aldehyde dehydrogenase (NADP(+)) [Blastocatellia bacterium]|nr:aldehyde dehydrogenase (NADP(+)) [Blastocatellia bacterium]